MHVALDRRHEDLGLSIGEASLFFFGFKVGKKVSNSLLHDPGAFHHLWKKHLSVTKQVTYYIHSTH